jgi:tetratricopeptide (TPR) repeat protein
LKTIHSFRGFIDEFLSKIGDMFHVYLQTLFEKNYQPLSDKLAISDYSSYLTELLEIAKIKNLRVKDIAMEEYQEKFGVNTYFYCIRGKLESDSGRFDKARYLYETSLDLDPTNTDALNNLGFLYPYRYNNLLEAQRLYEKALNINPYLILTLLNLGVLYRSLK